MGNMKKCMRLFVSVLVMGLILSGARSVRACCCRSIARVRSRLLRFPSIRSRGMLKPLAMALAMAVVISGCSFLTSFDGLTAVAQASNLSYPVVDTNQSTNYGNTSAISAPSEGDDFYGQDAQIDGNQPSYVSNGDGTVTDLVTGLMWTQKADWNGDGKLDSNDKLTYEQAVAYVDTLNAENYAGHSDWRMPTIKELYSLIDFSGKDVSPTSSNGGDPFINTNYFAFVYGDTSAGERVIDSQWATSTLYTGTTEFAGGAQLMFGVNFADGRIKGYPVGDITGPGRQEKTYFVLYVRGNTSYGVNDFQSNWDGTITDQATGLMWAQDDSGTTMDWEEALAYVQGLNDQNYLGYSDWYLPNAKELQSIVDYSRSPDETNSAAIDSMFNCTQITNEDGQKDWGFYWTSTTHASDRGGQSADYIAFGRGMGYMNGQFMDVHGAGCQRSDPKTGEPTYGSAPQGDVVRVDNFVRVVRAVGSTLSYATDMSDSSLGSSDSPNSNLATDSSGTGEAHASEENYVLFAPLSAATAYLIDRSGDVVNDWSLSGRPGNSVYLLEGGDLLATYTVSGSFNGGGAGGGVELLNWDGSTIWSYELATDEAQLHHDVELLPNGNVLMLAWEVKTKDEALAAGLSDSQIPASGEVWSEMILEYSPSLDQIVWAWHLWDHALPARWDASEHPEKIDLSYVANSRNEDWFHINSVDYNESTDQIVLSVHNTSEVWIIDHNLTTTQTAGSDGDLLYRFGNPAAYGSSGSQAFYEQHDARWIDASADPDYMHLLVFDNGNERTRPYSRVVELDLPSYGDAAESKVLPATIVWQYPNEQSVSRDVLFADHVSGAQRLKNGDTLICDGTHGRFFEVTPDGRTVWDYTNPYSAFTPDGTDRNDVFRCTAYSASYISQGLESTSAANSAGSTTMSSAEPSSQATAQPPSQGSSRPQAIISVNPSVVHTGDTNQMVEIRMNQQLMPPERVRFTSVTIGKIAATSWGRSGNVVSARFTVPSDLAPGSYPLIITFPGRNNETIRFTTSITVLPATGT